MVSSIQEGSRYGTQAQHKPSYLGVIEHMCLSDFELRVLRIEPYARVCAHGPVGSKNVVSANDWCYHYRVVGRDVVTNLAS